MCARDRCDARCLRFRHGDTQLAQPLRELVDIQRAAAVAFHRPKQRRHCGLPPAWVFVAHGEHSVPRARVQPTRPAGRSGPYQTRGLFHRRLERFPGAFAELQPQSSGGQKLLEAYLRVC